MNTTSLKYSGKVNFKVKLTNGKVITYSNHNSGLPDLMKVICKFLTGNGDTYADTPKYVDLRKEHDGNFVSFLKSTVIISGANYSNLTGQWKAVLNAAIPYENLLEPIQETDTSAYRIYLLSGEDKYSNIQELAYLEISPEELSRISAGTLGIIEWILTVSN